MVFCFFKSILRSFVIQNRKYFAIYIPKLNGSYIQLDGSLLQLGQYANLYVKKKQNLIYDCKPSFLMCTHVFLCLWCSCGTLVKLVKFTIEKKKIFSDFPFPIWFFKQNSSNRSKHLFRHGWYDPSIPIALIFFSLSK